MIPVSLLIAWRYLWGTRQERSLSTMVKISFFGIVIGTFSLALVTLIMQGFEKATYATIQGCHAPLTLQSWGNHLAFEALEHVLKTEFPAIRYSPSDIQYALVQDQTESINNVVLIKGIDPSQESQTTQLEKKILTTNPYCTPSLIAAVNHDSVLIGNQLAQTLNVHCGDTFTIYFVPEQNSAKRSLHLEKTNLKVGGIFKTGIEEFDANIIICTLDQLHAIFPQSGITSLSIAYPATMQEKDVQEQLKKRFNLTVISWKDRYPALVAALELEKYASFIILSLIILVASMSIVSLLFMQITQKRGDIALLKTLGTPTRTIRFIFIIMGMAIAMCGAIVGLLLAALCGLILRNYWALELPDAYFVTHIPVAFELSIFVTVFAVVIIISFFATWLPTRSIGQINCADVLRFEG